MPQAGCPILCFVPQIERDSAEAAFAGADGEEILVEPRFAVPVEQSRGKLRAMPTDQHMPPLRIAEQCRDARLVDDDIDRIKTAMRLIGQRPGMRFVRNPHIAAKLPAPRQPREKEDCHDGAGELGQLTHQEARPRTMFIIAVMGLRL